MFTRLLITLLIAASLGSASIAFCATEAELKERFKARYQQLQTLKQQGKVGETASGYVEAVKPEHAGEAGGVTGPENSDRRELYDLLAKQTGATPDAVAARNAARNFSKARPGEWLKHADGQWRKK